MQRRRVYANKPLRTYRRKSAIGAIGALAAGAASAAYAKYRSMSSGRSSNKGVRRPYYGRKRRVNRYRTKGNRRSRMGLRARISKLERSQSDTMSKLIYKIDAKDTLRPTMGQAVYGSRDAVSNAGIEAAIAQARFFDPSAPGTLITGSLATPTYQQKINISAYSTCVFANNYQVPCVITCGVAFPKEDTNIAPTTALNNGLADVGNPDAFSTLISYKDSPQFWDLWKVKLSSKYLAPGQKYIMKHSQPAFTYDPSFVDSHTTTYQRATKSSLFIYRIQGVLGHDTSVSTEQGMLPAGIDVYVSTNYYVNYNSGGAAIKTIVLSEGASQSFTNGGVVSQLLVDNQSYSVS